MGFVKIIGHALRIGEVTSDKNAKLHLYCRSGNRSGQMADFLRQQGFSAINVAGGMVDWEARGYAVER